MVSGVEICHRDGNFAAGVGRNRRRLREGTLFERQFFRSNRPAQRHVGGSVVSPLAVGCIFQRENGGVSAGVGCAQITGRRYQFCIVIRNGDIFFNAVVLKA